MNLMSMMGIGVVVSFMTTGTASLNAGQAAMKKLFLTAEDGTRSLTGLGKVMAGIAAAAILMKTGMAGVNAVIGNVEAYASYETELAHVQGLLNVSREEMAVLEDQATTLAQTTRFTRGEVMQAYWELLSAGFDVDQVMQMVNGTLMTAVSGHLDTADAVNVLTSALLGFGYSADDTMEVLDVLQTYIRYTKIHWSDYAASLGRFSSTAAATNQTLEETAAMFGLIMSRGLPAARSATLLRVMLSELQEVGKSPELIQTLAEHGVDIINPVTGEFRHLVDILDDVNRAFPEISELPMSVLEDETNITAEAFERLGILSDIFGRRGIAGFYAATTASQQLNGTLFEGTDVLRELIRLGEEEATGAMEGYYDVMVDTLAEQANIIKSTWTTIKEQIGEAIGTDLKPILEQINGALQAVSQFLATHPDIAKAIGYITLIGSLAAIVGGVIILIITLIGVLNFLGMGVLAGFLGTMAITFGVFALLILAAILIYAYWEDIKKIAMSVWQWVVKNIWPVLKAIGGFIASVIGLIVAVFVTAVLPFLVGVYDIIQVIIGVVLSIVALIIGFIQGDIGGALDWIGQLWTDIADNITGSFEFMKKLIGDVWDLLKSIWNWFLNLIIPEGVERPYSATAEEYTSGLHAGAAGTAGIAASLGYRPVPAMASGVTRVPRTGLYLLHEDESVSQRGSWSSQSPSSFRIDNFSVVIQTTGDDRLDGERIGRIAMEYMEDQFARVQG